MNEVEIPIKVSGLGALKAELRDLKGEIANATDPAEIARLSMAAGELKDKINDANEAVNVFASGSKFEQVSNGFAGIKDSIMSLDFEEASTKAKTFATTLSTVNPASILKGMGSFVSMLGTLGTAFVKLGVQILMNPLFLLVAAVVAIVAAVGFFLNKIGVLQVALDYLMIPINAAIAGLKMFGDFLGVTDYAAEEAAAKRKQEGAAASKQADTAINETNALMAARASAAAKAQRSFSLADDAMGREIALLKAQGKDTTDLERTRLKASIAYQNSILSETYALDGQIREKNKLTLAELYATGERIGDFKAYNKLQDEQTKQLKENETKNIAAQKAVLDLTNDLKIFEQEIINDRKKANADANKEKVKGSKDTNKIIIDHEANALELKRKTKDQELALMRDGIEKEQAMIVEKYDRQAEDLIKNTKYSAKEKIKLQAYYDEQEKIEIDAKAEANKLRVAQNEKESMAGLIALRLEAMVDGEAKELAVQADKYQKLRDAALADTKLTAEQLQEKLNIYNGLEIAENAKRQKAKDDAAKVATDAANALYFEITATERQKEIAALEAKYAQDQALALGNQKTLEILEKQHKDALADIDKAAALKDLEESAAVRDAKIGMAGDIAKGITEIGGTLIKDQEKLAKFNKASALVQIGVDTALAISSLVKMSQANALNGVTAGAAGIAQFASGVIQIATNIAKAKQILSSPGTAPSAGGGGGSSSSSSSSSTSTVLPQSASLFGQGNNSNTFNAGGGSTSNSNMTVTAIVSETQVTNVQNKINMINKNAEL